MRLVGRLVLLCLALSPVSAGAEARPRTVPTHDVDITYRIRRGGQLLEERTRWMVSTQLQRVDPPGSAPGSAIYLILDGRTRHAALINEADHSIIDMNTPPPGPLTPGSATTFVFRGHDTVADLSCDDWETGSRDGGAVLCFTRDGALLRVQAAGQTLVEAVSVNYAPANPALFRIPETYRHLAPPSTPLAATR